MTIILLGTGKQLCCRLGNIPGAVHKVDKLCHLFFVFLIELSFLSKKQRENVTR